jgi:hypothetical protein
MSRPPSRSPPAAGADLRSVSGDLLLHVASFLPIRAMASLAVADTATHTELGPPLRVLGDATSALAERAQNVRDLHGFVSLLRHDSTAGGNQAPSIGGLPPDVQSGPLSALLRQIPVLPANDRPQAVMALRAAVAALSTEHRSPALVTFDRIAGHGNAASAASAGEHVRLVTALFGITDRADVTFVELSAVRGVAGAAVRSGANVRAVARRHGIQTRMAIHSLETAATRGPAGAAVRRGEHVPTVARQHGIETRRNILSMELMAANFIAGRAVRSGQNLLHVARRHGIQAPQALATS